MFHFLNYLLNEQTEEKKNKHASLHFHLCDNRLIKIVRMVEWKKMAGQSPTFEGWRRVWPSVGGTEGQMGNSKGQTVPRPPTAADMTSNLPNHLQKQYTTTRW